MKVLSWRIDSVLSVVRTRAGHIGITQTVSKIHHIRPLFFSERNNMRFLYFVLLMVICILLVISYALLVRVSNEQEEENDDE